MSKISLSEVIIGKDERAVVDTVLRSGHLVQGEQVATLEKELETYTGAAHAVVVNSGTAALHTALYAVGITAGDEVITSPFTFVATANAIKMVGAIPIFADIDDRYFHLTAENIERKITKKTKAVLVVDLYGQPVDYEAIRKVCDAHHLLLIADSCQAIGAIYQGKNIGQLADITALSLYATKNLMSVEGGVILTDHKQYAEKSRLFRNHGQDAQYHYVDLGYNYRMTDILASIAVERLHSLEKNTHKRIHNAQYLSNELHAVKGFITPAVRDNVRHVFHQYTAMITPEFPMSRTQFIERLAQAGIESRVYYPVLLHQVPHLADGQSYTIAQKIQEQVVSLPVHPGLTTDNLNHIVNTIRSIS